MSIKNILTQYLLFRNEFYSIYYKRSPESGLLIYSNISILYLFLNSSFVFI